MQKALKTCPKSNKLLNLVTLAQKHGLIFIVGYSCSKGHEFEFPFLTLDHISFFKRGRGRPHLIETCFCIRSAQYKGVTLELRLKVVYERVFKQTLRQVYFFPSEV